MFQVQTLYSILFLSCIFHCDIGIKGSYKSSGGFAGGLFGVIIPHYGYVIIIEILFITGGEHNSENHFKARNKYPLVTIASNITCIKSLSVHIHL